jgi:SAM-dependent methyltransferase
VARPKRTKPQREFVVLGEQDWYRHPAWYDVLHTPGTRGEVGGLERIARRYAQPSPTGAMTIVEPACGTGRYLRVLAGRGHRVVGIDATPEMVAYAQQRLARYGDRARVIEGDMTDFRMPRGWRADFAFNPINSIRYLTSDAAMVAHLGAVRRSLRVGGVYAVGLSVCQYGAEFPSEDVWRAARGSLSVTQVVQYHPSERGKRKEQVHSLLIAVTPRREAHLNTSYVLRAYSCPQWVGLVRKSGLVVAEVADEVGDPVRGGWAGGVWKKPETAGYAIWVLRREE